MAITTQARQGAGSFWCRSLKSVTKIWRRTMLIFPLKREWYEKIKSGEKTIEYREVKPYWNLRINKEFHLYQLPRDKHLRDLCAIRGYGLFTDFTYGLKVANRPLPICKLRLGYTNKYMVANIKMIEVIDGKDTDLHIDKPVYAIHLADVKEE
jgi:hypothetical protein